MYSKKEIQELDILFGKKQLLEYILNNENYQIKENNINKYIGNLPFILDSCMYSFFRKYGYPRCNKVIEIQQLKKFHKIIENEINKKLKRGR